MPLRLFVALSLPDKVCDELTRLQSGPREARWVAPENFHLTLRFLGELDCHEAADVDAVLSQPLSARLSFAFGRSGRFR